MFVVFNIVTFNNVNMYLLLKLKLAFYCTLLYEITNLLHFYHYFQLCYVFMSTFNKKETNKERKKERKKENV